MSLTPSHRKLSRTLCLDLHAKRIGWLGRYHSNTTASMPAIAMDTKQPGPHRASDARGAKLHGRAFYDSIGSPKFVLAPMVDQSEFAWRMLSRSFMAPGHSTKLLAYTPMFHARLFNESDKYYNQSFQPVRSPQGMTTLSETLDGPHPTTKSNVYLDGNPAMDRPLFVQFCANDPELLLAAARKAAPYCDAVDLNLGCPQGIARKGHYGAFLQDDWGLIHRLINTLHTELDIPVSAKIRILESPQRTLEYARMVLQAGASIITVHGRRREQKGHNTGVADWTYIRYLRDHLPPDTVIFANGNILQHGDIERCLAATGADAVMSAEGNLHDPSIFAGSPDHDEEKEYWRGSNGRGGYRIDAVMRRYLDIIYTHILEIPSPKRAPLFVVGDAIVPRPAEDAYVSKGDGSGEAEPPRKKRKRRVDKTVMTSFASQNLLSMQSHLFSLLRHVVSLDTDIRDALSRCRAGDMEAFERVLRLVEHATCQAIIEASKADNAEHTSSAISPISDSNVADTRERCRRPWFVCQAFIRPLPEEAYANGSMQLSKKQKKLLAGS